MTGRLDVMVVAIDWPAWADHTAPFHRAYCRRHGFDLHWVTRRPAWMDGRPPSWLKLMAHRLVPGSPFVLVVDLDLCLLPDAPDVRPVLATDRLSMARQDISRVRADRTRRVWKLPDIGRGRWNTGFIGVPRAAAPILERLYATADPTRMPGYEQEQLNRLVLSAGVPVCKVSAAWNWIAPRAFPRSEPPAGVYGVHLAGRPSLRADRAARLHARYAAGLRPGGGPVVVSERVSRRPPFPYRWSRP